MGWSPRIADLFLEDDPDFVIASDYANLVKIYQFWNLHALLDGKIDIESSPGHGTTILAWVPLRQADREPSARAAG